MPNSNSPRLINVGGYAESKYVVARKSGSNYNELNVVTSISANILEDNTSRWWLFGWHESGSVNNYGRATGTYETTSFRRLDNQNIEGQASTYINSNSYMPLQLTYIVRITPLVSGPYMIETVSSSGDPNFSIYNASINSITNAKDDLDFPKNKNAKLIINLVAGQVYYLKAYTYYDTTYGYNTAFTIKMCYNPEANMSLEKDATVNLNISSNSYKLIKFIPTTSGYFDFFTKNNSGDPFLYLFDESGYKLSSGDDELSGRNALIRYYLYSGKTYYIAAQGYRGGAANFSLSVIPSILNRNTILLNSVKNISASTYTNVFEFTAPYTEYYDFYTFDKTEGDPYLELYDSSRNKIAFNDDGNGALNALIKVYLTAGQKYYIHARGYNPSTISTFKLNIRLSISARSEIYTSLTSSASIDNNANQIKVFKFVATETRYYTVYSNNVIVGDPYLELLNEDGAIMFQDDDSAGALNAKINFYATAGETYYIVSRGYSNTNENIYNLLIN